MNAHPRLKPQHFNVNFSSKIKHCSSVDTLYYKKDCKLLNFNPQDEFILLPRLKRKHNSKIFFMLSKRDFCAFAQIYTHP